MPDLANRGPLGLKGEKAARKPPRPIPKISAKKRARKAAEKAAGALEHMRSVKALPCICCGHPPPSYAHHVTGDGKQRSDFRVLPLCFECHQGPTGYHAAKAEWVSRYGPDYGLLDAVAKML